MRTFLVKGYEREFKHITKVFNRLVAKFEPLDLPPHHDQPTPIYDELVAKFGFDPLANRTRP